MRRKRVHAREQARLASVQRNGIAKPLPYKRIFLVAAAAFCFIGACWFIDGFIRHGRLVTLRKVNAANMPTPDYQLVIPAYHSGAVKQVVFRPDGGVLATVGADGAVKVWDVDHGSEVATLRADKGDIQCLAFSPDGKTLLGGTSGGMILVWDQAWNRLLQLPCPGPAGVTQVGFTANGRFLIGAASNTAFVYNVQGGFRPIEGLFQRQMPTYVTKTSWESGFRYSPFAFAPSGSLMALTGGAQGMIGVPPSRSDGENLPISVTDLATMPNRQTMLLGHGFRCPGLPLQAPAPLPPLHGVSFSLKGSRTVFSLAFSPNGRELLSASDDFTVRLWNLSTAKARLIIPSRDPAWGALYSPDSHYIAAGYLDGRRSAIRLELRSVADGHLVRTLTRDIALSSDGHSFQSSVAFSSDGHFIVAAGIRNVDRYGNSCRGMSVWRVSDGKEVYSTSNGTLTRAAFSPDGHLLAAGGTMGQVKLWETKDWNSIPMHIPFEESDTDFMLDKYSRGIVFGADNNAPAYGLNDGKPVPGLLHTSEKTMRVDVPGSYNVLSVSGNGTAQCWDMLSRKMICRIQLPAPAASLRDLIVGEHTQSIQSRTDLMEYSVKRTMGGLNLRLAYTPMEFHVNHGPIGHDRSIIAAATGRTLALGITESPELNLYDLCRGRTTHHLVLPPGKLSQVGFVDKGHIIYSLTRFWSAAGALDHGHKWETETVTVSAWDVRTGHPLCRFVVHDVTSFACACTGTPLLALRDYNHVQLLDLRTGIKRHVLVLMDRVRVPTSGFIGLPADYDLSSLAGKIMAIVLTHAAIALSPDGRMLAVEDAAGTFELWNTSTGHMEYAFYGYQTASSGYETSRQRQSQIDYPPAWDQYIGFTPDSKRVIYGTLSGDVILRQVSHPETPLLFKGHVGPARPFGFNPAQTVLGTVGQDGMRLWRLLDGKQLLHIDIQTPQSWIAAAPDGRFDGTTKGISQAYFVHGEDRASVRSLFDHFYTPGIIRKAFLNELGSIKTEAGDVSLKDRPSVNIGQRAGAINVSQVRIPVTIQARGKPVVTLLAFVNGKLVYRQAANLKPLQRGAFSVPIDLAPGGNLVEAFAVDDAQIWSDGASVRLDRKGAPSASDLYVISIGINAYHDVPLQFAKSDAIRVAAAFKLAGRENYRHVFSVLLVDGQATRDGIDAAVREVARHSRPQDAFVFYFSGHGLVTTEGESKEVLLAGADLTDFNNSTLCRSKGIPLMQIRDWIRDLPPQRQLWLFDSCDSGTLTRSLNDFTASKDFQDLQFGTGVYFAAATRPADLETITENPRVKSGLFTQVLLEGLGSLPGPRGGDISVSDLGQYVLNRLPQYSYSLLREVQQPAFWDPQSASPYKFTFSSTASDLAVSRAATSR